MFGISKKIVYEGFSGLLFHNGKLVGILKPGAYWLFGSGRYVLSVDQRPANLLVGGQDVTSLDGAQLRISIVVLYAIVDPLLHYRSGQSDSRVGSLPGLGSGGNRIHQLVQIGIRDWVTERNFQDAFEQRASLAVAILPKVVEEAKKVGLDVTALEVLEFSASGTLKSAMADRLKAQVEGETALARARNEASTMRNLLNTARLVREHPGLLELRVLASGQKPRVTFVVGGNNKDAVAEASTESEEH